MFGFTFHNRFIDELPGDSTQSLEPRAVEGAAWSKVAPTPVAAPKLLICADDLAAELGLSPELVQSHEFAEIFAGNRPLEGMSPYAACYGGHQFGHWAGQLGDGRAMTIAEVVQKGSDGLDRRYELQLKGAGPTPYSRRADGRAVLRSSVREFLCSEAMFHLGVPTTRALCLVRTGDQVLRDMFYDGRAKHEPGAIVCRVAPSFIRFGSFELPSRRGDKTLLEKLVDFTVERDFGFRDGSPQERRERWFAEVCERTARMVAHWMRVGFVHGVMNTDNMSVLGLTLDYGPYGWLDNFDPNWTPNTTDAQGRRYRFAAQPSVAHWNLARLSEALLPVFSSAAPLEAGLERYVSTYNEAFGRTMAHKFGFSKDLPEHEGVIQGGLKLLEAAEVDMTLFFRRLAEVDAHAPSFEPLEEAFYSRERRVHLAADLQLWLDGYAARLREAEDCDQDGRRARMNAVNPRFVMRNYLAQEAIDLAEAGDLSRLHELYAALRRPYLDDAASAAFIKRRPDWAKARAGCSMLSCSS